MTNTPALDVVELKKTYANGVEALKGISLSVQPGDFFALLGPNGAGKSTLIGILSSLVNPTGGDAKVFGVSVRADRHAAMRLIGLVPQELNFNMFEKPFDICVNQAGFYGIPRAEACVRAEKYLKQLVLWDKAFQSARQILMTRHASRGDTVLAISVRKRESVSSEISGLVGGRSPNTGSMRVQARSHSSRVRGFFALSHSSVSL